MNKRRGLVERHVLLTFTLVCSTWFVGDVRRCAAEIHQVPSQSVAHDHEIRQVLERFFALYASGDVDGMAQIWADGQTSSDVITDIVTRGKTRILTFSNLKLSHWQIGVNETNVRTSVDVAVADNQGASTTKTAWCDTFRLIRRANTWRIADKQSTVFLIATELRDAGSRDVRLAVLDRERDLAGEPLRSMLVRLADGDRRGPADRPIALLETAVEIAIRGGDRSAASLILCNLGMRQRLVGRFDHAIDSYTKAIELDRSLADTNRLADAETGLAGVYYARADYIHAREHYLAALAGYNAVQDPDRAASTEHSIGNVDYMEGDWLSSLAHYTKSVEILESAAVSAAKSATEDRRRVAANGYQAIGMVQRELGDFDAALAAFQTSLVRYTDDGDMSNAISVNQSIGSVYRLAHDYGLALRHLMTAYRLSTTTSGVVRSREQEAELLAQIAEVYKLDQRAPAALDYFGRSLAIYEELSATKGMIVVLAGMGSVHLAHGDFVLALAEYQRCLALAQTAGDRKAGGYALLQIGLVFSAQAKHDQALVHYQKAVAVLQVERDERATAAALVLAGATLNALGHSQEAQESASKAMTFAVAQGARDVMAEAHLVLGEAQRRRGERDAAIAEVQQALDIVQALREERDQGTDARFFTNESAPLVALIRLLVDAGKTDAAFAAAERVHQWWVQNLLGDPAVVRKGLPVEMRREERRLLGEEAQRVRQLDAARARPGHAPERLGELERALADIRSRHKQFADRLRVANPELEALRARTLASPGEIRALLTPRSALLLYQIGEERTHLFVCTANKGLTVHLIQVSALDLQRRVFKFRDLVARQQDDVASAARDLFELLVRPAESELVGVTRLLIVPDGALRVLPFQALQDAPGRYVIESRAIAYGTSATSLTTAHAIGQKSSGAARLLSAGIPAADASARERLLLSCPDLRLDPLAHAEAEARAVVTAMPARARVLIGADAKGSRIRAEARTAGALHLAVTGVFDDASPQQSLLLVGSDERAAESGTWSSADIMDLDHSANLVVLSHLSGEPSAEHSGAGVAMLAWAWLVSGAPNAVIAQWVADTPATARLFASFHAARHARGVSARLRPSEALRRATLPLLRGRFSHPFYWAAFEVFGDV